MNALTADLLCTLILVGLSILILVFPQRFTKKDLKADENKDTVKALKRSGWLLILTWILILAGSFMAK